MKHLIRIVSVLSLVALCSCANRGTGPQGGPRDSIPPKILRETPLNSSVNYHEKTFEIQFDEYVQLADIQKNVLISPPQKSLPSIKAFGKKVRVEFQDTLIDSSTYTIDFGSAICDYNEKTPLKGYVFSFSTGDFIDSLEVSGILVDAESLNSVTATLVGIQADVEDSAFSTKPFTRITRTDDEGYFTIHNIREGSYRLYALNDVSSDNMYQPGEGLAFVDTVIHPRIDVQMTLDTLWQDTLAIDSISGDTLFTRLIDTIRTAKLMTPQPGDLVLWYFTENKQRHYYQSINREEPHAFTLIFSAPQDSMPLIKSLNPALVDTTRLDSAWVDWMDYTIVQSSQHYDTITCWLTDSSAISQDSIYIQLTYLFTDSAYNLVPKTDTIFAVYRQPRMSAKALEAKMREKQNRVLDLKTNASSKFEIYDTICITSTYPSDSVHIENIHLSHKVDTTMKPMSFTIRYSDSLKMYTQVIAKLEPEHEYELVIDSAAMRDVYGKCNDEVKANIKLKSKEEYSSLMIRLVQFDERARLQLLTDKDVVVRELPAQPLGTKFEYLTPATYYLRLYIDANYDGEWTTGDWLKKRQPEQVYYFTRKLKLRANWDFEETFDHLAVPQLDTKPAALRKKYEAPKK